MARVNPYAIDPNLAQGFSNLTQALIGNSGTDRDMSAVRANDALTNRRNQETENLLQKNQILDALNQSVGNVSGSEPIQNALALALTGQEIFRPQMTDDYYEAGEAMEASNLGIESPADIATPFGQYRQGDPVLSDLARTLFGDLTYQPNQLSSAFTNLGTSNQENARNNELVDIILNGTPEQAERAMMAYKGEGKYNLPGLAGQEIDKTLASKEKQNKYEVDQNVLKSKYKDDLMYGKGGQGDRDTQIKDAWERFKVEVEDKRKKYEIDEKNNVAVKKFEKEQEIIKYKFDNRTIEIQVGKDGRVYLDPTTAQKMVQQGQSPNFDEETGLFYVEGQQSPQKPNVVKVEVGEKDIYLNKETADALGIQANAEGQYILKGKPKNNKSGGSGGSGSTATGVKLQQSSLEKYDAQVGTIDNWDKIPSQVRKRYREIFETDLTNELDSDEPRGNEARLTNLYIAERLGTVSRATVKDGILRNTYVYYPTALLDFDGINVNGLVDMGYSRPEAEAIMTQVN